MSWQALCPLDQLEDPGSAGFAVPHEGRPWPILVVRQGDQIFAYVNSCPHIGAPLDWTPGRFLDAARTHILCANHGALFQIEDGLCIGGPCAGKSLSSIPVKLKDGVLLIGEW